MKIGRVEVPFGAQNVIIESGKLAKQAGGAVTVTYGGTVVLVTACMAKKARAGIDFFPLMVEYQEKTYSAGKIPGGFFKREGRPTQKEILTARLTDRPLRPLFPEGLYNDVQIVASVLSSDGENDPDILALLGASCALMISEIPFSNPVAAVRIGCVDGEFVINPTYEVREKSNMDYIVAGQESGLVMIEGESQELSESKMVEAFEACEKAILPLIEVQNELRSQLGKEKVSVDLRLPNPDLIQKVKELTADRLKTVYKEADKDSRHKGLESLLEDLTADMSVYESFQEDEKTEVSTGAIAHILHDLEAEEIRRMAFEDSRRMDGRNFNELRDITCEVGVLPRTHGASLFTRGQTQSLSVVTLGTKRDEQMVESLEGTSYENFMLHYNFPSFSVGETRPMRGPGRREIGHGALAAKSLKAILPTKDEFPYTIRLVSEILESNGSSSMATVCAGTLALMEAGVPIKDPVAGISVGLISKEKDEDAVLLTDILGLEDHFGDMDFKVAGTRSGITAIQLDLKIKHISTVLLAKALDQAKEARFAILDKMEATIPTSKEDLSPYAPRIISCQIPPEKIGELIGPGGKVIKKIMEDTGVGSIDIDDDGKVLIASDDSEAAQKALAIVKGMMEEPEVGKIYMSTVKRVMNFGAFCEFLPGKEGLVHVSELSDTFVKDCNEVVKVGDTFNVKLIEIDKMKRINLSKKQAAE